MLGYCGNCTWQHEFLHAHSQLVDRLRPALAHESHFKQYFTGGNFQSPNSFLLSSLCYTQILFSQRSPECLSHLLGSAAASEFPSKGRLPSVHKPRILLTGGLGLELAESQEPAPCLQGQAPLHGHMWSQLQFPGLWMLAASHSAD